MGNGNDDEVVWTYSSYLTRQMFQYHDLNQNTANIMLSEPIREMNNRQDDKSPNSESSTWKCDNPTSPSNKTSRNSNHRFKNAFFADDTCSNDFFYDEEFTIPFDANLTERRGSEVIYKHLAGGQPHHGIVTSKSDNCLYHGDLELSESDHETSRSDHEMTSSSDSSGLFNQPLFSSHSECPDEFALDGSCDQDSFTDEVLPKYPQKPINIKHHYKISYDKGPLKIWSSSDEPASKTSFEMKMVTKPLTITDGNPKESKQFPFSINSQKPANGTRKSKRKSSHKDNMSQHSKSSHLVTWGTIKSTKSNTSNDKSRTTWKEIQSKPSPSGKSEPSKANQARKINAKSCHEINFNHKTLDEVRCDDDNNECDMMSAHPVQEKSCELFKIFQDKKLKECEEITDANVFNTLSNLYEPGHSSNEYVSPTTDFEHPILQDIFSNDAKKSKSDKRLKFKSNSSDQSNLSPIRDSEKSPKIIQSANLASTNSTDSSVQTSLIINIPVKTENKSLQTSLILGDEKQESTARDIWNTSSYLFSRPLPDLSFLKNSTKFVDPKIEVVLTKQQKSSSMKDEAKSAKKSNSQNQNSKSGFKQTFSKSNSKNIVSCKTSQESYGRSKNSSSFSFHSSSSSGIDPGTSDSGRQSSSASSKDESLHSEGKDPTKTPPKPPRLFKNSSSNDQTRKGSHVIEEIIQDQLYKNIDTNNGMASKSPDTDVKNSKCSSRSISLGMKSMPDNTEKAEVTTVNTSKVVLRSTQPGYARPTKSILVRNRNKENRRSWSNNQPSTTNWNCSLMQQTSPRKRPLSVPDGTLLEIKTPSQEEIKVPDNDPVQADVFTDNQPETVSNDGNKQHSKEDNNTTGSAVLSDQDYEKFRAKKSVSFSETISYHPTSSSLSPLESPKSPINSVPTSPDVETAQETPKCCTDNAQDIMVDVELPPNDFLVSPNLSPSSSLSDSTNNLQPLSFDLQQKKDLVMDVVRAVEITLKYVNRCRDPLAKIKLCSTVDNPKIGNLLLEHLCPSIHAIVLDGIKPTVPSLFGKVKSSACKVFEDSLEGSSFDSLQHLMRSMRDLKFLNNQWLKFNAYLLALLNLKVLDMWLASLRKNKSLLNRYYNPTSFLQLSCNGSNINCQTLFFDVITYLQPLSQIQFRLEYDFEVNFVERKRQAFIAEQLLNKHVSHSAEIHAEAECYLTRMYNTLSLDSSAPKISNKHPTSSLYLDNRMCEVIKNSENLDENSESSSSLFWSSVGFSGLAKGFLQRTQNRLMEKLSQSKDIFSLDGNSGLGKVVKQWNESPLHYKHPQSFFSFDSFTSSNHSPAPMTRSDCPRSYFTTAKQSTSCKEPMEDLESNSVTNICYEPCGNANSNSPQTHATLKQPTTISSHSSQSETSLQSTVNKFNNLHTAKESTCDSSSISTNNHINNSNGDTNKSQGTISEMFPSSQDQQNDTVISPSIQRKNSTFTSFSSSGGVHKTASSLLSSYGTKLVDVFDRLLLSSPGGNSNKGAEKSPFMIKKQYHSEDQISRHITDSPKNGFLTKQHLNVLVNSTSCDHEGGSSPRILGKHSQVFVTQNFGKLRLARSLCHYVAMDNQFLSFEKDAELKVIKEVGHDFFLCWLGDKEGLVYKVCVSPV